MSIVDFFLILSTSDDPAMYDLYDVIAARHRRRVSVLKCMKYFNFGQMFVLGPNLR